MHLKVLELDKKYMKKTRADLFAFNRGKLQIVIDFSTKDVILNHKSQKHLPSDMRFMDSNKCQSNSIPSAISKKKGYNREIVLSPSIT